MENIKLREQRSKYFTHIYVLHIINNYVSFIFKF